MLLEIKNLFYSYNNHFALQDINLKLTPSFISVIGPNGSGKSTLLKCLAGILKYKGEICFNEKQVKNFDKSFYGTLLSYLPQQLNYDINFTVFEMVLLGLTGSLDLKVSDEQLAQVMQTLEELHIANLSKRYLYELSGGQQQITAIAQAIIRKPKILVLDEPLNSLDIHHQFEILEIIEKLCKSKNIITFFALHDLNLAARYSERIIVINKGRIYDDGIPSKVITKEMIQSVYKIEAEIIHASNKLYIQPMGLLNN
ncbi:ABC transporter ATP-binding protein [Chondrinema litorale]|uniref:ABC transporter ATP-binding protein n=1 Tax=Chondrinema litorale TaxID=2994555 RepID=UPI00254365C6|nr:ABC transporter ATP-binding protein [Chondrinema litorale]UZR96579.1 ABC transporter ATP-binding protein [Chondrinema litorale]